MIQEDGSKSENRILGRIEFFPTIQELKMHKIWPFNMYMGKKIHTPVPLPFGVFPHL